MMQCPASHDVIVDYRNANGSRQDKKYLMEFAHLEHMAFLCSIRHRKNPAPVKEKNVYDTNLETGSVPGPR
jgi:hypothetical protein